MAEKIVAFLQNQWFKHPDTVKRMMRDHPERRERYISAFLFMGCLTGRRLRSVLGEQLCDQIIWEEVSPEIGDHAASRFPADIQHMQSVIVKHNPAVILAFGKIAENAVMQLNPRPLTICAAHPAARHGAISSLKLMRDRLSAIRSGEERP